MINFEALFKLSYGLYIVSSGDENHGNGFVSNTFFQVTAEPAKFASCCNKENYTSELIEKTGHFGVSILHQKTDSEIFGRFGYKSGKEFNKMEGMNIKIGQTGVPIVLNDGVAFLECKVLEKVDVGTHWLFIGELLDAQMIDETLEPITYAYYRKVKKGLAPKNAPTYIDKSKIGTKPKAKSNTKYECSACGYVYDESQEDGSFADLPDDWTCPVCGADKEDFYEI